MDYHAIYDPHRPSYKTDVSFLNDEGPEIDDAFGGLTSPRKLQPTVQSYVQQHVGYTLQPNPSERDWEVLFQRVAVAETKADEPERGPFAVFNRMVVKIGEHKDEIDPWINLIPDQYGLCVVKSAFAVLLSAASKYADKRQAILDAFVSVRDIIRDASTKGVHFQRDSTVYRHAGDLYESIVDAIHDLLLLAKPRKPRSLKWPGKSHKKDQLNEAPAILKTVSDRAEALRTAVDNCRDATIAATGKDARRTLGEVQFIGWKAIEIKDIVTGLRAGQEEQNFLLQKMDYKLLQTQGAFFEMAQNRDEANAKLIQTLYEQRKKDRVTITKLEHYIMQQKTGQYPSIEPATPTRGSRAVIILSRLFEILSDSSHQPFGQDGASGAANILETRNSELETILTTTTKFDQRYQSQAHNLLKQDRFFDWMNQPHPDMLLVDGNIQSTAGDTVSPMSLLCANLGLTIARLEPDAVIAQFYCGMHASPRAGDAWCGPAGMLRSLAGQILAALAARDALDLDFLDHRSFVHRLEAQDIGALCELLHALVRQFDADTSVYCVVDGVSRYDVDFGGAFGMLDKAMQWLQDIVCDDELRPRFKVLMTVPFASSPRLRRLVDEEFYLSLPPLLLGPRGLSGDSLMLSVSRPSTPLIGAGGSDQEQETTTWGGEDYDD
ncbi:hypothetical protein CPLU01_11766 [Colletotrichum plurivorum]|uniref:Uncharacterized protein n=1 Tax=Colletotrichum plurivorum TaxID=2175906 RepID=A0A8H6N758_9PEZI|nr:hypothetical protein CPLU01_11766 [Colletotrichum plurivorum]